MAQRGTNIDEISKKYIKYIKYKKILKYTGIFFWPFNLKLVIKR